MKRSLNFHKRRIIDRRSVRPRFNLRSREVNQELHRGYLVATLSDRRDESPNQIQSQQICVRDTDFPQRTVAE